MTDALRVEEGALAWLPAHDVVAGEVLDHYDVPRVGILHREGNAYYFECIAGDGQETGIWVYAPIEDSELGALVEARGPAEVDNVTSALILDRRVTVAISAEDRIVEAAVFESGREGPVGLAKRMIQRWEDQRLARERASGLLRSLEGV